VTVGEFLVNDQDRVVIDEVRGHVQREELAQAPLDGVIPVDTEVLRVFQVIGEEDQVAVDIELVVYLELHVRGKLGSKGECGGLVIVAGDENGLTAKIYPNQDIIAKKRYDEEKLVNELQKLIDAYNKSQPTYRRIAHIIIRENPFRRNTTRKILRQYAAEDIPA